MSQTAVAKRAAIALTAGRLARLGLSVMPSLLLPHIVPLTARLSSCVGVSSMRGPHDAQLSGAPVEKFYYFGGMQPPRMPMMIALSSVGDRLTVTLALKCRRVAHNMC